MFYSAPRPRCLSATYIFYSPCIKFSMITNKMDNNYANNFLSNIKITSKTALKRCNNRVLISSPASLRVVCGAARAQPRARSEGTQTRGSTHAFLPLSLFPYSSWVSRNKKIHISKQTIERGRVVFPQSRKNTRRHGSRSLLRDGQPGHQVKDVSLLRRRPLCPLLPLRQGGPRHR